MDAYTTFLTETIAAGYQRVIVLSRAVADDQRFAGAVGDVANLRSTVKATLPERTALTLRFNARLGERCATIGAEFVDVTSGQLDSGTNLIDERFRRKSSRNHHLAVEPYSTLIADALLSGHVFDRRGGDRRESPPQGA